MDKIKNRVFCIPENPTFKNFTGVFKRWEEMGGLSYGKMLINSIWISLLGPLITAFVTATVTYVLVFYSSKVTRMIYKLGVFVSILPIYGAAGAMYKLLTDIKIINSPLMFLTRVTLFGGNFFYYYNNTKKQFIKVTKDSEEEISIEDFYDINNSSLFKCKSETFSICKLMKCFINYCKLVFE